MPPQSIQYNDKVKKQQLRAPSFYTPVWGIINLALWVDAGEDRREVIACCVGTSAHRGFGARLKEAIVLSTKMKRKPTPQKYFQWMFLVYRTSEIQLHREHRMCGWRSLPARRHIDTQHGKIARNIKTQLWPRKWHQIRTVLLFNIPSHVHYPPNKKQFGSKV